MTRSANGASRSPAIHNASGARSTPRSRRPGSSVRKRSAWPPAPSVASTSTAPVPSGACRVSAGVSSSTQRSSRTGTCPWFSGIAAPPTARRPGAPASRSLSESANLALGKYARAGSGRGHDARACGSDNVAQSFIAGRGEVLFVGLLVVLPCLGVPDLEVLDRTDHHAVLGQVGVATVIGRQRDPALGVGMLFVGGGGEVAEECPGIGVAARRLGCPPRQLFELIPRVDGEAVVLALGDHQPSCQRVAKLGGQREPPLVVELGRVGAEKHLATSCHSGARVAPLFATLPHIPPLCSNCSQQTGSWPHFRVGRGGGKRRGGGGLEAE